MSVIDLLTRVETICNKYDKYDFDKQKDLNISGDDAFARLYADVDSDIVAALEKAESATSEKKRASAVAINAEIRCTKARLLEQVPKLQKLALKKVKGLSPQDFAARNDLALALPDRIQAIPDGAPAAPKQTGGWTSSTTRKDIKFDSDGKFDDEYFQQSEESNQFRQEYEMRKMKQQNTTLEDIFDSSLNFEDTHFKSGFNDGFSVGLIEGKSEAREVGLKSGFQTGEELGFYRGCIDVWKSAIRIDSNYFSVNVQNKIKQMDELVRKYPFSDPENEMATVVLDNLRLKFRAICATLKMKLEYDGYSKTSDVGF